MADTKRECPLKWWVAEGYTEAFAAPCTRELCQWWLGDAEKGDCAITFAGLALAEAEGYRIDARKGDDSSGHTE